MQVINDRPLQRRQRLGQRRRLRQRPHAIAAIQRHASLAGAGTAVGDPDHLAQRAQLVQRGGGEPVDARRENPLFQIGEGQGQALQLLDGFAQARRSRPPRAQALPARQKPGQCFSADGRHLVAQVGQRAPAQHPQHLDLAPRRRRAIALECPLGQVPAGQQPA